MSWDGCIGSDKAEVECRKVVVVSEQYDRSCN
jgi:hypothetical protein